MTYSSTWLGRPQEAYNHGGRQSGSSNFFTRREEREEPGKLPLVKPTDLVRSRSLSQEQHRRNCSHDAVTSHQVPPLTHGDYNLRWDLGGDTEPNHSNPWLPNHPLINTLAPRINASVLNSFQSFWTWWYRYSLIIVMVKLLHFLTVHFSGVISGDLCLFSPCFM